MVLPIVHAWAEMQESLALKNGVRLTEPQLNDARRAGVTFPEKIRVMRVHQLPQPDHEDLVFMARQVGLFSERATGLCLGYAIWILDAAWDNRLAWVHECVHVSQHEKLNGLRPFLNEYLRECIDPGFPFGRMEQQSLIISRDICKPPTTKLP